MYCKKCGAQIKEGAKFCTQCGTPVSGDKDASKGTETSSQETNFTNKANKNGGKRGNKWLLPLTAVVLVVFVIGLIRVMSGGKQTVQPTETEEILNEQVQTEQDQNQTTEELQNDAEAVDETEELTNDPEEEERAEITDDAQTGTLYDDPAETGAYTDDQNTEQEINEENDTAAPENVIYGEDVQEELRQVYLDAHDDELEISDALILAYYETKDQEDYYSFISATEDVYDTIMAVDPNLRNVLVDEADYYLGDDPLTSYLVRGALGTALSDTELGSEIRAAAGTILYGLGEWALSQNQAISTDNALELMFSREQYLVFRSKGTISSLFQQISKDIGYDYAIEALEARNTALYELQSDYSVLSVDWIPDYSGRTFTEEELEEIKTKLVIEGRKLAVAELMGEWQDYKEEYDAALREWLGVDEAKYDQYLYYLMEDDQIVSIFVSPYEDMRIMINDEGMMSLSAGSYGYDYSIPYLQIIDFQGNVLYENKYDADDLENSAIYSHVTPSGNLLKVTFHSDMSHGNYQKVSILDADGNETELFMGEEIQLSRIEDDNGDPLYTDYVQYEAERIIDDTVSKRGYINVSTGEIVAGRDYGFYSEPLEKVDEILGDGQLDEGDSVLLEIPEESEDAEAEAEAGGNTREVYAVRLNDEYCVVMEENTVYDYNGNVVKDLSDGEGIAAIWYGNERYRVVTNTGWYYILDENFETVLEPMDLKLDEYQHYKVGKYGLLIDEDDLTAGMFSDLSYVKLLNDQGEEEMKLQVLNADDIVSDWDHESYLIGNSDSGWYDLRPESSHEMLLVEYPEDLSPVALGHVDDENAADDDQDNWEEEADV